MKYIDAHTHIFEYLKGFGNKGELRAIGSGKGVWANGEIIQMFPPQYGEKEFVVESLIKLLDDNEIEKAVVLQGSYYGFQNAYVSEAVNRYSSRLVGAGTFDPFCRKSHDIFCHLTEDLRFRCLKFELSDGAGLSSYHQEFPIYETLFPFLEVMEKNNMVCVLDIGTWGMGSFQIESVIKICERFAKLKVVLCHLFAPHKGAEEKLKRTLRVLKKYPNIWFDLAALPFNTKPDVYPFFTARSYVEIAADIVGHKKLIWGTDVPSVLVEEEYYNLKNYLTQGTVFSARELEDIYFNNADEVYFQY